MSCLLAKIIDRYVTPMPTGVGSISTSSLNTDGVNRSQVKGARGIFSDMPSRLRYFRFLTKYWVWERMLRPKGERSWQAGCAWGPGIQSHTFDEGEILLMLTKAQCTIQFTIKTLAKLLNKTLAEPQRSVPASGLFKINPTFVGHRSPLWL